jgi:hypothetical protein
MRSCRRYLLWIKVLMGTTLLLTGCAYNYDAVVQRLSPAEQAEFAIYRNVMTGTQKRTYLAKTTAAERTAYLNEISLAQRFQQLDPVDREIVRSGAPRVGMSAEALLFIWGDPADTAGDARHYSRWHYMGSSLGRSASYHPWENSNRVEVYLANNKVLGWVDTLPIGDHGGECHGQGC